MTCPIRQKVTPHFFSLLLLFISVLSLATALIAEHSFDILPCSLCIYERYVFLVLIFSALTHLFSSRKKLFALELLVIGAGCILTFYHIGVEQHWWQAPASCGGAPTAHSIEELRMALSQKSVVRCDKPGWIIFNISAVIWTFLMFFGLLVMGLAAACSNCKANLNRK